MKNIRVIAITVLLLGISTYFSVHASAEKKPWERTITGKVLEIDKKYNIFTVEVKTTEGFFKRVKIVKIPIKMMMLPNKQTKILIGGMNGGLKDIDIGDIVNIDYEMTASAGNIAKRIEVAR